MLRFTLFLLSACAAFGQSSDANLTQTLINEIRGLRQDMEASNITSQRVQIVLFRLQSQTAIVTGAQQRAEAARTRLAEVESQRRGLESQVHSWEEATNGPIDSAAKAEMQANLPRAKATLEALNAEESARRSAASQAEGQAQTAEARLVELQAVLDRIDQTLDEMSRQGQKK